MSKFKVLFQLTGSIACFKACQIISRLVQNNFEVQVVASPSSLNFVGIATLEGLSGKSVHTISFENGKMMGHIQLARWADILVLCPATAKTINQLAHGVGEGLIHDLFLANNFLKPYLIAPAMNTQMLLHPATKESLKKLISWGTHLVLPESGALACGESGEGRLADPTSIYNEISRILSTSQEATL